ncbi:hypothetical protein EVA_13228 [gut metagenome]|uniref:Uncharacterized protein n=1 Tax=gut metagenome TaxID=749906 RepID=J9GA93_9ZZZZ
MTTGLQCTSCPLRFSVQAISSRADSNSPSAFCPVRVSRINFTFSVMLFPAYFNSWIKACELGMAGRSVHNCLKGSSMLRTTRCPSASNVCLS